MTYEGLAIKIERFREENGISEEELAGALCYLNTADYRRDLIRLHETEQRDLTRAIKRGRAICKTILRLKEKK